MFNTNFQFLIFHLLTSLSPPPIIIIEEWKRSPQNDSWFVYSAVTDYKSFKIRISDHDDDDEEHEVGGERKIKSFQELIISRVRCVWERMAVIGISNIIIKNL